MLHKHFHNSTIFDKFQQQTKQREKIKNYFHLAFFAFVVVAWYTAAVFIFIQPQTEKSIKQNCAVYGFFLFFKVQRKRKNVNRRNELLFSFERNTQQSHATCGMERVYLSVNIKKYQQKIASFP